MFAIVWLACALYLFVWLDRGWVPHDEGTLAHAAERVLNGELPHRDFAEVYTGGLSYANALAFLAFGTNLLSLRILLFLVLVLLWIPTMYYVARRFARPALACLSLFLAVIWSVPNYSAAVPSWYNLAFAVAGTGCLFRYLETRRRRWLVLAGLAGGLSILVKVVGLYFVTAALLFLLFLDQQEDAERPLDDAVTGRVTSVALTIALGLFATLILALVSRMPSPGSYFHFALPGVALLGFLAWNEWEVQKPRAVDRARRLGRSCLPLLGGAAAPILLFLVPYAATGSLGDLLHGTFVAPSARFTRAGDLPPSPLFAVASAPVFYLVIRANAFPSRLRWLLAGMIGLAAVPILLLGARFEIFRIVWHSVRSLVPLLVIAGVLSVFWLRKRDTLGATERAGRFLLLAVLALWSLVQFPYAHPIYFLYVAPLVMLAVLALRTDRTSAGQPVLAAILSFYLVFGLLWINPSLMQALGQSFIPDDQTARLELERAGIRVSPYHKEVYERLVRTLRTHAHGDYTFVTPDSPEVYFLSGLSNPTPTIFEFLDDPIGRDGRVLEALRRHEVNVIAINRHVDRPVVNGGRVTGGSFSDPPSPELVNALKERYPHASEVGGFLVRWRE